MKRSSGVRPAIKSTVGSFVLSGLVSLIPSFGHCENAIPEAERLSIKIKHPSFNENWYNQKTYPYTENLVIALDGKICPTEKGKKERIFTPSWGGVRGNNYYYSAEVINDGKGYLLIKEWTDLWEDAGVQQVQLVNFSWNGECFEEKELIFKDDASWSIEDDSEEGSEGGLFMSKDRTLLVKIPSGDFHQADPDQLDYVLRPGAGNSYTVYSIKTLDKVGEGHLTGKMRVKVEGSKSYLLFHGTEFELFGDWVAGDKGLKK